MLKFILFSIIVLFSSQSFASASMRAPECKITGEILKIENRRVGGKGISDGQVFEYTDLHIKVLAMDYTDENDRDMFSHAQKPFSCNYVAEEIIVYQQRDPAEKLDGTCIEAVTNFSADGNFRSGNWIYDIKTVDDSHCNKP